SVNATLESTNRPFALDDLAGYFPFAEVESFVPAAVGVINKCLSGKVQGTIVSCYLKLRFFGACTTRRTWTLLIFRRRILYIKLGTKMPRRAMRCTTSDLQRTIDMTIDQQVALDEALVVYDVLRLTLFYKAFLVTADVPETYMQEFWATATVHHHLIRFKMNNKKRIINLEYFREMLHIFINKCLSGKVQGTTVSGYLKLRFFGACTTRRTDPSILRRNKVNWHYVRDDQMFTTIKLVSRHQNTQQFGAMLHVELTNKDIRNSAAYKECYDIASGAAPHKTKASVRKTQSSPDTTMPPPTAAG
nr:hypothetical protein [Tanacetum cinerariifolium]